MKKFILSVFIVCITNSAHSESMYELAQAHCKKAETVAYTAQTYRQLGMQPSAATEKLMTVTANIIDPKLKEDNEKLIFFVVQDAYTVSVVPTKELKKTYILDFAERHYLTCLNSFQKAIDKSNK